MEIYLLRTLNKRKECLKSVESIKKTLNVSQSTNDRWNEIKTMNIFGYLFCLSLDWNKSLSTVYGRSGKPLLQDNITRSINVIDQTDDLWINNLIVCNDLMFVFYREAKMKVYRGKKFEHVWTGPMIATYFGGGSTWSMFGGFVQKTKTKLYMIQQEGRRIVEIDLPRLAEAIENENAEEFKVIHIGQGVQAFAVSQKGKERLMYVNKESMLFADGKEIRTIDTATGVTNCMTAVGNMFMIGSYNNSANIYELVDKRGSSLHWLKMEVPEGMNNDIKDLKHVKLKGAHIVVGLRIYTYLDLFLIRSKKIHVMRDSISTRRSEGSGTAVNHSLTVDIFSHTSFDMIVTQNSSMITSIAVNI